MDSRPQFVDPAVSRAKFDAQLEEYLDQRAEYEARGWLLVEACFPTIFVVMAAPRLTPPAVVCGVLLDYANYDAAPPSLRLVDPFTRVPYKLGELPTRLTRVQIMEAPQIVAAPPGFPPGGRLHMQVPQALMQGSDPAAIPFLCLAGTREYHEHPGHSGDSWELHRAGGAGKLVRLLDIVYRYGVEPISSYAVQMAPVGFELGQPPA
jgi:hypothetical protein